MMPMILQVHDGMAWLAQLCLFLMLGLLVTPSELLGLAGGGLVLALALIFVIRPLTVLVTLWPFGFNRRELSFISWVGLRGAVPIVLALFPIIADLPEAQMIFHVAFFIVLVSLVVQGTSIAPLARKLRLEVPAGEDPYRRLPLDVPATGDHELMLFPLRGEIWQAARPSASSGCRRTPRWPGCSATGSVTSQHRTWKSVPVMSWPCLPPPRR